MHNAGLVRNLLNGNCQEFIEDFRSFLGQCPSFLHSVGKDRFFPAFFFGMFATAHDSDIANNNERIFFRFDNDPDNPGRGNLKIAFLTNKRDGERRRIVRCFTIADRENSFGSRFSEEERQQVEERLQGQGDLTFMEYKVFAWRQNQENEDEVECRKIEEGEFTQDSASPCNGFDEVTGTPGLQNNHLPDLISRLADNDAENVMSFTRRILQYTLDIYDRYNQLLNLNNRPLNFNGIESDHHGFLSGFLMNFGYRHAAGIYLELFVGGGYTDITFLVRGVQRLGDSVPIIIELKAGRRSAADALEQAENYVNRCPVSSLSIHTSSGNAVCIGLNFDLDRRRFLPRVESFLERESSLVERLFEPVANQEVETNVRDYLLYPSFGVPAVPGVRRRDNVSARDRRIFLYTTGFSFSSIAFARGTVQIGQNRVRVAKCLFHYHDNDRMLGPQGGAAQINVGDRTLTMVLRALRGRNQEEEVVVFNIRHTLDHQFPNRGLNLLQSWQNASVYELTCNLDPNRRGQDDLGLTVDLRQFDSLNDYQQGFNNVLFQGQPLRIGGVSNIHNAAKIMMNTGWQNVDRYRELFQAISNLLHPNPNNAQLQSLKWVVNRDSAGEAGFHSVLHGLFYVCNNPSRVIIEFQLGGGEKLDLVLLRSIESRGGTHPVGMELKFAGIASDQQRRRTEARNQIERYAHGGGYKRVTDGNAVVLSDVIFNDGAQGPNTLLSACNVFRVIDLGPGTADDLPGR